VKAGWSELPLGDLCGIEIGGTPPRGERRYWDKEKSTNNVWLSIADLPKSLHARLSESAEHLSNEGAARVRLVKAGTLLVSFKLTLGRLAYADIDLRTNEAIAALTVLNSKQLDQRYLYWFLTYFDWQRASEGDEKVKGKTLNKAKLNNLPVIVPPLAEQQRIVAILDEAFARLATATANAEKNLKNAGELFDSHLNSIFARKGPDWVHTKLRDAVSSVHTGPFGSMLHKSDYVEGGTPIVNPINIVGANIVPDASKTINSSTAKRLRSYVLSEGDIVIGRRGEIGRCAPSKRGGSVAQDVSLSRPAMP
jgi:type I restriction enzyme S subunit